VKTTVEIDDELFRQAKTYAATRGVTLRQLIEAGLELAMAEEAPKQSRRRVTFPLLGH
jgi:hypothetical protein